jgi:hypothetical protein
MQPSLLMAANGDNRIALMERLAASDYGGYPVVSATPLGFFQDEVVLFFPLLVQELGLQAQFPLRLRPETEQELATRLWQPAIEDGTLALAGVSDYFLVRRMLDMMQLAGASGTPIEDIPTMLQEGFGSPDDVPDLWQHMGDALQRWRRWCLDRGLLTYGLVTELYWRYLLPHPAYQQILGDRYQALFADDVDEYPAIAQDLFSLLLDRGLPSAFTYNPEGAIRWGLGADPYALQQVGDRCQHLRLDPPTASLGATWAEPLVHWVREPMLMPALPPEMQAIETVSRADLLRYTADVIAVAVERHEVSPQDIAIIGPGVDAIARYTLRAILTGKGIAVDALNDQQPLNGYPKVRSLLTLLALVYPGLGRLLSPEAIAEMLVVLSQTPTVPKAGASLDAAPDPVLDPVRAGLLVDHCFVPDPTHPKLLETSAFPRWDRLGYQPAQAYDRIRLWIDAQVEQQRQRLIPSPVNLLDRAIQSFFSGGSHLPYDQLTALRELMETAQHYWEVDSRLRQADATLGSHADKSADKLADKPVEGTVPEKSTSVGNFIQLLRSGTITADPYPVRSLRPRPAVTLATLYQYRANRCVHPWQFWLDAGSALWLTGGSTLFGAPLFWRSHRGQRWAAADAMQFDQQRLGRQLGDLLYRVDGLHETGAMAPDQGSPVPRRIVLCHSDLAITGQEQNGPLLSLVNAVNPMPIDARSLESNTVKSSSSDSSAPEAVQ